MTAYQKQVLFEAGVFLALMLLAGAVASVLMHDWVPIIVAAAVPAGAALVWGTVVLICWIAERIFPEEDR